MTAVTCSTNIFRSLYRVALVISHVSRDNHLKVHYHFIFLDVNSKTMSLIISSSPAKLLPAIYTMELPN